MERKRPTGLWWIARACALKRDRGREAALFGRLRPLRRRGASWGSKLHTATHGETSHGALRPKYHLEKRRAAACPPNRLCPSMESAGHLHTSPLNSRGSSPLANAINQRTPCV